MGMYQKNVLVYIIKLIKHSVWQRKSLFYINSYVFLFFSVLPFIVNCIRTYLTYSSEFTSVKRPLEEVKGRVKITLMKCFSKSKNSVHSVLLKSHILIVTIFKQLQICQSICFYPDMPPVFCQTFWSKTQINHFVLFYVLQICLLAAKSVF